MNTMFKRFVLVVTFILFSSFSLVSASDWWDSSWHYRVELNVSASGLERTDWPVEFPINFTSEFLSLEDSDGLDSDSIRVIEYDSSGNVLYELNSAFEPFSDFDSVTNARGNVVFVLNGTTLSSETRYFYIYFDNVNSSKSAPSYSSSLNYDWDGDEFTFGNSVLNLTVDSYRIDGTSGLYFARRIDSGKTIFNTPDTERTTEYMQYNNGATLYGFDFDGNATLTFDSEVKMVISQAGSEVLWGTKTLTNFGNMEKKYTIYAGTPWIKVEQIYENINTTSVTRSSSGINALAIDAQRAFGLENLIGPSIDPYSWKSATKTSTALGVGIINIEESGTTNYFAQGSIPAGKIGIQLGSADIDAGSKISQEAVIYFNDEDNHTKVQDLQYQFVTPVNFTKSQSERFDVDVNLTLDYSIYNLNGIIMFNADVFLDNKGIVKNTNVTLDMGTVSVLDDQTIKLFDDGLHADSEANDSIFGNSFIIGSSENTGQWNSTVELFDEFGLVVYTSSKNFDVTNEYSANLIIHNPSGLIFRTINATFSLFNYRNDTPIGNADVTCAYNGTDVLGITDLFNGNYSISFISRGIIGAYELVCNGSKDNNTDIASDLFLEEVNKTVLDFTLTTYFKSIPDISQTNGDNFSVGAFVNNSGAGGAYVVNVSIVPPTSDFNFNSSFEECGDVLKGKNCSNNFVVYTLEKTTPGNYNITFTSTWKNLDGTFDAVSKNLTISVGVNPILDLSELEVNGTIEQGQNTSLGNFTLNSEGNFEISNLTFDCVSGAACSLFNYTFIPNTVISLPESNSSTVEIFVDVSSGFDFGNYSGILEIYSDNFPTQNLTINVEVPMNDSWTFTPHNCSSTVLIEDAGAICQVLVNNTGNLELDFTITPTAYNYVVLNKTSFVISKQNSTTFYVNYNTTGATQEQFDSSYFINSSSLRGNVSNNFDVFLDVVFGPTVVISIPNESSQLGQFSIRAVLDDRSGATINWVKANVTLPDLTIDTVDLINIDSNIAGGISTWEFNYTNTIQRGVYGVLIYAEDMSGGIGSDSSSLEIYAKLNISLFTGWEDYLLGETGSIYYSAVDGAGAEIPTGVNISLYDSNLRLRSFEKYETNEKGILDVTPSFTIPDDAPVGSYNLTSENYYNDTIVDKEILEVFSNNFSVHNPLFVNLDTTVIWYPNGIMTFYVLAYTKGSMDEMPSGINLTVYDPAQNIYLNAGLGDMSIIQQTPDSVLYYYKYAMPVTTPVGNFLATVDVNTGQRGFHDVESFIVSSGGPFDLILTINDTEVERKENVEFDILMKNMGEVSQDVFLDFWVSDQFGNNYSAVTGEAIFVPAHGNTTITRSLYIYPSQPLELHTLTVKMDYSMVLDPIVTTGTFLVLAEGDDNQTEPVDPDVPSSDGSSSGIDKIIEEIFPKEPLVIVDVDPSELNIGRGDMVYVMVELKNNLNEEISDIDVDLIVEDFFNLTQSLGRYSILPRDIIMVPIKVSIPQDFESGFYTGKLKVVANGETIEQNYQINIFDSKDELINHRVISLRAKLESLKGRIIQAKRNGVKVDALLAKVESVKLDFNLVDKSILARRFLDTLEYLDRIEDDIEEIEYELNSRDFGFGFFNMIYLLIAFSILILVVSVIVLRIVFIRMKKKYEFGILKKRYLPKGRAKRVKIKKTSRKELGKRKTRLKKNRRDRRKLHRVARKKSKIKRRKINVKLFNKKSTPKKKTIKPVRIYKTKRKDVEGNLKTLDEQYRYGKMSRKSYNAIKKNLQEELEKI